MLLWSQVTKPLCWTYSGVPTMTTSSPVARKTVPSRYVFANQSISFLLQRQHAAVCFVGKDVDSLNVCLQANKCVGSLFDLDKQCIRVCFKSLTCTKTLDCNPKTTFTRHLFCYCLLAAHTKGAAYLSHTCRRRCHRRPSPSHWWWHIIPPGTLLWCC